jgi:hypothetical protein
MAGRLCVEGGEMKVRTLAVLAGVGMPLIATGAAPATYLGIYAVEKPNPYGLLTVNVYAEFDNPGGDRWESAGGAPGSPLNITVLGGSFYNHQFGSNQAPQAALVAAFPSLAYDSFYTAGRGAQRAEPDQPAGAERHVGAHGQRRLGARAADGAAEQPVRSHQQLPRRRPAPDGPVLGTDSRRGPLWDHR